MNTSGLRPRTIRWKKPWPYNSGMRLIDRRFEILEFLWENYGCDTYTDGWTTLVEYDR